MIKKAYIIPQMEVEALDIQSLLVAVSDTKTEGLDVELECDGESGNQVDAW